MLVFIFYLVGDKAYCHSLRCVPGHLACEQPSLPASPISAFHPTLETPVIETATATALFMCIMALEAQFLVLSQEAHRLLSHVPSP